MSDHLHRSGIIEPNGHPTRNNASACVPLQINGQEILTETSFPIHNPATGHFLHNSSSASTASAIDACVAAEAAFPAWAQTKPSTRRDIFLKAASILEDRALELQEYMIEETGSGTSFAAFNTITSAEFLRDAAGRIAAALEGSAPICADEGRSALVLKEPYGVVLGIAPWNAPFILGFRAVVYPLAAGNTTILKGSELAPKCCWAIGSVLKEAGLPDGCLNVLVHRAEDAAEVTKALIENESVKKVCFTGSTSVGRIVAATAGKALKPVLMELGGKASAIVFEDADIELAAKQCALGALAHGGQVCMSTERIIVPESILPAFSTALCSAISEIFPSPITIITPASVRKNKELINDALTKGASLLFPLDSNNTRSASQKQSENASSMMPTVIQNVTPAMQIYHTESFGPTVSLIALHNPSTSIFEDRAISLANDTLYGLAAAVFTSNLFRGLHVAKKLESGAVHINSMTIHDEASLPHGGVKSSGWGRFNAGIGIGEFLKKKTVTWVG